MMQLVDHILYVAKNNHKKITHLQIHKISYFIFGYLIREGHESIAKKLYNNEKFQAWTYGPVIPSVYEKFKKYNNMPILSKGKKFDEVDKLPKVNEMILNLVNHDVFDLVKISHNHYFWREHKQQISKNQKPIYPYKVLRKEFTQ
ncbi:Panacea domain-containing protein [Oceanobacillus sp. CFH 90083]|uniref:Panacea domain-containing protein n=1 Tax=Oceanobacillus sp. CFH 90083 TaxID=2592336 RepID=UPI00128C3BBA|nr:type II toxin-antitoxin system antitoxin SocA domain-containing protein [Oceanobacillus sp. CFH 90083]